MRGSGLWIRDMERAMKSSKMEIFISATSTRGERKEKAKGFGLKLGKYTKESGTKE
jgi:hypothetical protein